MFVGFVELFVVFLVMRCSCSFFLVYFSLPYFCFFCNYCYFVLSRFCFAQFSAVPLFRYHICIRFKSLFVVFFVVSVVPLLRYPKSVCCLFMLSRLCRYFGIQSI